MAYTSELNRSIDQFDRVGLVTREPDFKAQQLQRKIEEGDLYLRLLLCIVIARSTLQLRIAPLNTLVHWSHELLGSPGRWKSVPLPTGSHFNKNCCRVSRYQSLAHAYFVSLQQLN